MLPPISDTILAKKRANKYDGLLLYLSIKINLSGDFRLCVGEHSFDRLKNGLMIQLTEPDYSSANGAFYPIKHYAKKTRHEGLYP